MALTFTQQPAGNVFMEVAASTAVTVGDLMFRLDDGTIVPGSYWNTTASRWYDTAPTQADAAFRFVGVAAENCSATQTNRTIQVWTEGIYTADLIATASITAGAWIGLAKTAGVDSLESQTVVEVASPLLAIGRAYKSVTSGSRVQVDIFRYPQNPYLDIKSQSHTATAAAFIDGLFTNSVQLGYDIHVVSITAAAYAAMGSGESLVLAVKALPAGNAISTITLDNEAAAETLFGTIDKNYAYIPGIAAAAPPSGIYNDSTYTAGGSAANPLTNLTINYRIAKR